MRRHFVFPLVLCPTVVALALLFRHDAKAVSSLVLGYALDESSGTVALDASGFSRNATLVNAPAWLFAGRFSGGLSLNGTSQYLRTNSPGLPTGDFTWAIWIRRGGNQSFQALMEAQGTTAAELELNLENSAVTVWSSGSLRLTTITTVPLNAWTHVTLTRSGSTLRVYVNGALDPRTGSDSRTFNFSSCPLLIGVDADSGCTGALNGHFNGAVDEAEVYDRALSLAEIQEIMNTPLGGGGADTTPPIRSTSQALLNLPSGTTQSTISLTTDEDAICRFDVTPGIAYASMASLFASTGTTTHATTVAGLIDGGSWAYHTKCQDPAGNANPDDFVLTVSVAFPPVPPQTTYYVAPSGSDQNPGTIDAPFRSLERARQAVRAVNGSMSGAIAVFLRGGEYNLSSPLIFDELDSGSNGFDVVYGAYPGETPVVSGGQAITGWVDAGGGQFRAPVGSLRFRQLYVNGKRAIRARTPNAGSYNQVVFWDTANRRVEVGSGQVVSWQRPNQVELIVLGHGVNQSNLRVSSTSGAVVTPLEPERTRIFQQSYPPKGPGNKYFFENAFEFLDAPGEWYLNTDTSEVLYRPLPGENMASAVVVAPVLERLITVAGTLSAPVHHLQFRGLTFEHATWLLPNSEGYVGDQASLVFTQPLPDDEISSYPGHRLPAGVHVEAADFVRFERNTFRHMGGSALNLYRAVNDSTVIGNVITDVSGSGISIDLNLEGNPGDSRVICRRNLISNNYIAGTGRDWYQSVGIMAAYADSIVIEHNELTDMPYTGITMGWGWADQDNAARNNTIRYNEIYDVLQKMSDGGGIYTLSRQPGTLVAENYVHEIVRTEVQGGFNISGIYLDEGSSLIIVQDNVLESTGDRGIFQNANGGGNILSNNDGASAATKAFAGLEPAFDDIRPGAPAPPPPPADTTAPVRSNGQPAAPLPAGTSQASLSLSTDESAVCRLATASGVSFGAMPNTFSTTGDTSHATLVTGLIDGTLYSYYVKCLDAAGNNNLDDFLISFTVAPTPDTTPPIPSNGLPSGILPAGTIQTVLTLTTNENATCRYGSTSGVAYGALPSVFTTTGGASHATSVTGLTNGGNYVYYVRCQDTAGNASTSDLLIGFAVAQPADITPPVRSNGQPAGALPAGTTETTLSLTTDESASCRHATTSGLTYSGMPGVFTTTGGLSHSTSVAGLVNGGSYVFHVRCQDTAGNPNTNDFVISFTVIMPAGTGLIAAYSFNQGSGTSITDASGNGHTGVVAGATWISTGKFGKALSFDGVNDWVTVGSTPLLNLTTGMTLEAWVYPTNTSGIRDILIKEGSNVDIYNLYSRNWRGRPESNASVGGTNRVAEAGTALPANAWTHVAGTYDGATLRLFINGALVASTTASGSIAVSSGVLRIGGNSLWGEYFKGRIDEVRIYNRALSQAEIQTDRNTPVSP